MSDELELPDTSPRDAELAAMRLLTRREHSCQELKQKLQHKGFKPSLLDVIIQDLKQKGFISDKRFAESYMRSRVSKGYGPNRIFQELKQRGVGEDIIIATIIQDDPHWYALAHKVREKRFGSSMPANIEDKAKQTRFLQYRGFDQQHIKYAFSEDAELMF